MMLKNYSYSLYFICMLILNTSDIIILFHEQEQERYFYMWYPESGSEINFLIWAPTGEQV